MKTTLTAIAIALGLALAAHATTNEIRVSIGLKAEKTYTQVERAPGVVLVQMAGSKYYTYVLTTTTAWQPVSAGGITSLGWFYARNLNATNTVYFSWQTSDVTVTNMMLLPGEPMEFRLYDLATITNLHAKGSTGGDVEYTILEK